MELACGLHRLAGHGPRRALQEIQSMSSRILRSLATAALLGSVGCGNSGTGTLAVQLVDAPADVKSIFVTIESVTVQRGDSAS